VLARAAPSRTAHMPTPAPCGVGTFPLVMCAPRAVMCCTEYTGAGGGMPRNMPRNTPQDSRPSLVSKCAQDGRKVRPGWSKRLPGWSERLPGWSKSGHRMARKCSQDGPKVVPGWSRSGPRMVGKWSQDGPKVHRPAPLSPQHFRALQGTLGHFRAL
jgi:hypothetical protein